MARVRQLAGAGFYARVCGLGFCAGAACEAFMLRTGFYEKVERIREEEAAGAEERRAQFEAWAGYSKRGDREQ